MESSRYEGLTSQEAEVRIKKQGLNEFKKTNDSFTTKILKLVISPISLMLIGASLLSFFSGKTFDGYFILVLMLLNHTVTLWQEWKADNSIKKLNENLVAKISVLRDGQWIELDSRQIVPGDVVKMTSGQVIPADGKILYAVGAALNESMLTGESLPKEKKKDEKVFSGSILSEGVLTIQITETGSSTYFGKTLSSVKEVKKRSVLEKDIVRVTKFLSALSIFSIILLTLIFLITKKPLSEVLELDLTLLIAGIPISLPTVMTLIIELGVVSMAQKGVVVRRLSSLEDVSNVDYLLTDKTGTITLNIIEVQKIITYGSLDVKDVIKYAGMTSLGDDRNSVNQSILRKVQEENIKIEGKDIVDFKPFDLEEKYSYAKVKDQDDEIEIFTGAPQVILKRSTDSNSIKEKFKSDVDELAKKGYKSVAVLAKGKLAGLLGFRDTLRPESKEVLTFLRERGIGASVVTGDNLAITKEIIKGAGIPGNVINKEEIDKIGIDNFTKDVYQETAAFSEVLPNDKFELVKKAKEYFTVASNGDGVNDLPAVKEANVGFAVKNAVDALKSSADIVLLSDGISVIKDAIIEGRKVFNRINSYAVYRISESQRLIVTAVVLGLLFKTYPLTPLQLIILALLNDIPIISLAFDKVESTTKPEKIKVKERYVSSSLFGLIGVLNSLILFFTLLYVWHVSWPIIQTIFFLKLTVSGHMLIYVTRTKKRWFKSLPAKEVILATSITQIFASFLALSGIFMSSSISFYWVIFVWIWAFFWMQVSEITKDIRLKFMPE